MSQLPSETEPRWCPTCGTLVPSGSESCPHCGMPLPGRTGRPDHLRSPDEDIESRPTNFLPRMASALPDVPGSTDEGPRRDRSTLAIIVAAICAVLVLGGTSLVIFHPWDPDLYDTRAQQPADTSMEGFPGTIDRLQGQDSGVVVPDEEVLTGDEASYRDLTDALGSLDGYADELDEELDALDRDFAADTAVREADFEEARGTSIAISNLIDDVQDLDMSSGVYLDAQRRIVQLGNYLRNRADAITDAWKASLSSDNPSSDKLRTLDGVRAQNESYAALFRDARRGWDIPEPPAQGGAEVRIP